MRKKEKSFKKTTENMKSIKNFFSNNNDNNKKVVVVVQRFCRLFISYFYNQKLRKLTENSWKKEGYFAERWHAVIELK